MLQIGPGWCYLPNFHPQLFFNHLTAEYCLYLTVKNLKIFKVEVGLKIWNMINLHFEKEYSGCRMENGLEWKREFRENQYKTISIPVQRYGNWTG